LVEVVDLKKKVVKMVDDEVRKDPELIAKTTRSARMLRGTVNGLKARLTEEKGRDATDAEAAAEVLDYGRMWKWIVERLESEVGPKTVDQIVRIVEIVQGADEINEAQKEMSESEKERDRSTLHKL